MLLSQTAAADELRSLRRSRRAARRDLDEATRADAEAALAAHLLSIEWVRASGLVSVFNADDGEPEMGVVIAGLRAAGCEIALPILRSGVMSFRVWAEGAPLEAGEFGLLEPATGLVVGAGELGASLTPLVAFDPLCNRIGRGAGFYDRTFGPLRGGSTDSEVTRPFLVGVAFEVQHAATVPVREHDVPMDVIVTNLGIRHRPPAQGPKPVNPE